MWDAIVELTRQVNQLGANGAQRATAAIPPVPPLPRLPNDQPLPPPPPGLAPPIIPVDPAIPGRNVSDFGVSSSGLTELGTTEYQGLLKYRNKYIEDTLAPGSTFPVFKVWLSAVEDWIMAFSRTPLSLLAASSIRFIARHSITHKLFEELDKKRVWEPSNVAEGGEVPWTKFIRHLRDTLHIAEHNLRITLRQTSQG